MVRELFSFESRTGSRTGSMLNYFGVSRVYCKESVDDVPKMKKGSSSVKFNVDDTVERERAYGNL